jgi:hypothetical protein
VAKIQNKPPSTYLLKTELRVNVMKIDTKITFFILEDLAVSLSDWIIQMIKLFAEMSWNKIRYETHIR